MAGEEKDDGGKNKHPVVVQLWCLRGPHPSGWALQSTSDVCNQIFAGAKVCVVISKLTLRPSAQDGKA